MSYHKTVVKIKVVKIVINYVIERGKSFLACSYKRGLNTVATCKISIF